MKICISAENIQKAYGKVFALEDVSLTVNRGEILALLGSNGAGKTTLIKILATLLTKDKGTVEILGYDLDQHEQEIRYLFGYVGQDTDRSAYARLNVIENLHFFGALRGLSKQQVDQQIEKLSSFFDFEANLTKEFMKLSGGQKQTVIIMRALLHDPLLVYLDEPTKGLDPIVAQKMRSFLKNYAANENKSLILTTHILSDVENLADRVSFINKGKIIVTDTVEGLKSNIGVSEYVELSKSTLPPSIKQEILKLEPVLFDVSHEDEWVSFGVTDFLLGTEAIIKVLREANVQTKLRHRQVSMEDVFVHYVGNANKNGVPSKNGAH